MPADARRCDAFLRGDACCIVVLGVHLTRARAQKLVVRMIGLLRADEYRERRKRSALRKAKAKRKAKQ